MFQGVTRQSRIDSSVLLAETLGLLRCYVALGLKCQLFSSSALFALKQLSLQLIIPDFFSQSSGFSPSLPTLLAVAFRALETALIFKVSVHYFSQTSLRL